MVWQDYVLLLVVGGAALFYYLRQKRRPKKSARSRTGNQLTRRELSAWRQLQAHGFKLEEIHPQIPIVIAAEAKKKEFNWEGNFSVSKNGRTYLVKVVRGDASLASAGLRRELLLDYLVFQPRGMFLYNGEKEVLQELNIIFEPGAGSGGREELLVRIILILLIVAGLALLYRLVF